MSGSQRRIVPCDRHEDDFSAFSMHLCRIMPPYGSTSRSLARLTSSIASPGLVLPGGGGGGPSSMYEEVGEASPQGPKMDCNMAFSIM